MIEFLELGVVVGVAAWFGQRSRAWLDAPSAPNLDNYQRTIKYWEQVYLKEFTTMKVSKQTEIVSVTITLDNHEAKMLKNFLLEAFRYKAHERRYGYQGCDEDTFTERLIKELS
jgi:hypothetical protein